MFSFFSSSRDQFGCQLEDKEFELGQDFEGSLRNNGFTNQAVEEKTQLFSMVLQEIFSKRLPIATEPRSMAIVKVRCVQQPI